MRTKKNPVYDGTHVCLFCQQSFEGWGHNPEPLRSFKSGRVCDDCNQHIVVTVRIALAMHAEPVIPARLAQAWINATVHYEKRDLLLALGEAHRERHKRAEADAWAKLGEHIQNSHVAPLQAKVDPDSGAITTSL